MERDFFDELGDTITKATKNLGKRQMSSMKHRR